MAVFILIAVLAVVGVLLLGPLMLPGALVVGVAYGAVLLVQRHHAHHAVGTH